MTKIPVWQMVKEACEQLNNTGVSNKEIREYISNKYGIVNANTINCTILMMSVNKSTRTHYPENQKERHSNDTRYDVLFNVGRGQVELYCEQKHGKWEIVRDDLDKFIVRKMDESEDNAVVETVPNEIVENKFSFALEKHLQYFIAGNLNTIDKRLRLYANDDGADGLEFKTDVGFIDILAQDEEGNFTVFELKLSKGSDAALGQIQRYMGWVRKHLANGKKVSGVIVAKSISKNLKYAVSGNSDISLFEYKVDFRIDNVPVIE